MMFLGNHFQNLHGQAKFFQSQALTKYIIYPFRKLPPLLRSQTPGSQKIFVGQIKPLLYLTVSNMHCGLNWTLGFVDSICLHSENYTISLG